MATHQAPPSLGFSRQEQWSRLPFPSPMREHEVTQSCPTLSDPMDCSLPGSSVHGIFQARVLEWGWLVIFTFFITLALDLVLFKEVNIKEKSPNFQVLLRFLPPSQKTDRNKINVSHYQTFFFTPDYSFLCLCVTYSTIQRFYFYIMVHISFGNLLFSQDIWVSLELLHSIPLHKPVGGHYKMWFDEIHTSSWQERVQALGKGREQILNPVYTTQDK